MPIACCFELFRAVLASSNFWANKRCSWSSQKMQQRQSERRERVSGSADSDLSADLFKTLSLFLFFLPIKTRSEPYWAILSHTEPYWAIVSHTLSDCFVLSMHRKKQKIAFEQHLLVVSKEHWLWKTPSSRHFKIRIEGSAKLCKTVQNCAKLQSTFGIWVPTSSSLLIRRTSNCLSCSSFEGCKWSEWRGRLKKHGNDWQLHSFFKAFWMLSMSPLFPSSTSPRYEAWFKQVENIDFDSEQNNKIRDSAEQKLTTIKLDQRFETLLTFCDVLYCVLDCVLSFARFFHLSHSAAASRARRSSSRRRCSCHPRLQLQTLLGQGCFEI